jgi:hypothetical protein
MATSAVPRTRSLRVDCRMTATKIAVRSTSSQSASQAEEFAVPVTVKATSSRLNAIHTETAAAMAPANCATQ